MGCTAASCQYEACLTTSSDTDFLLQALDVVAAVEAQSSLSTKRQCRKSVASGGPTGLGRPVQRLDALIPQPIAQSYNALNVTELLFWQAACIHTFNDSSKPNLVFVAPTSGGKTMVAEVLLVQQLLLNHGTAMFIVPFVSLVEEKAISLRALLRRAREAYYVQPPAVAQHSTSTADSAQNALEASERLKSEVWLRWRVKPCSGATSYRVARKADIVVCTPEKACAILNHRLETASNPAVSASASTFVSRMSNTVAVKARCVPCRGRQSVHLKTASVG